MEHGTFKIKAFIDKLVLDLIRMAEECGPRQLD